MAKTKGARGFGSIDQLKSGNFRVRYTDPNGNPGRARTTFRTKREADKELSRIRHAIETGTWHIDETPQAGELDPKTITLRQLAETWRKQATNAQGRRLEPKTLSEYERLVNSTLATFRDKPIRQIQTQQIDTWRAKELEREVYRQTNSAYKHLKQLMEYALEKRWVTANPCTLKRASVYKSKQPIIPNVAQVALMLEIAPEPLKTLLAIASEGGLRKGELLELRRKDIDLKPIKGARAVRVNVSRSVQWVKGKATPKAPKSLAGIRGVLLPDQASEILRTHLRRVDINPEALLFSRGADPLEHFGQFQLRTLWDKVKEQAGYKGTFHSLRAYHLTQYATEGGASIKELQDRAGHATPQMVMVYQHNPGREAELVARLNNKAAN
jgi:integrase